MPSFLRPQLRPEDAKSPQDVRIIELRVEPWPDGRRIRVHLTLTPFQENPSLEVILSGEDSEEAARADIIETAENRIVFTLHIRKQNQNHQYHLTAHVHYPETGIVDSQTISVQIDPDSSAEA